MRVLVELVANGFQFGCVSANVVHLRSSQYHRSFEFFQYRAFICFVAVKLQAHIAQTDIVEAPLHPTFRTIQSAIIHDRVTYSLFESASEMRAT